MGSRKLRLTSMFVALAAALAVMGLQHRARSPRSAIQVAIVNQPADAGADELITASAFDPTGGDAGFVQVQVTETVLVPDIEGEGFHEETGPVVGAEVTFELATGAGLATTDELVVESRFTNADGNATFGPEEGSDNPLSIGDANQPFTTDYRLIPVATPPGEEATSVEGDAPTPFDIWEDGCHGAGCSVDVRNGNETLHGGRGRRAWGPASSPREQRDQLRRIRSSIFASSIFFHATTGDGTDTVFLVTHITRGRHEGRREQRPEAHGVVHRAQEPAPWIYERRQRTRRRSIGGQTLFVAMAPKCPNKRTPSNFAPCIVSQMGDGDGGSFIRGYVLGGDPPRRT